MKIRWFGQACFLMESEKGIRIVTDPFNSSLGYKIPSVEADMVTVSHEHYDHNATDEVKGNPEIVRGTGEKKIKDIAIKGVETFHDKAQGAQRGKNTVFSFEIDGMKIIHLGDLGHILTQEQIENIGEVDILLIPVGGTFTIDAQEASEVVGQLKPKITIPMHYKTPAIDLPIEGVERFLSGNKNIEKKKELESRKEELPKEEKIIVLEY